MGVTTNKVDVTKITKTNNGNNNGYDSSIIDVARLFPECGSGL